MSSISVKINKASMTKTIAALKAQGPLKRKCSKMVIAKYTLLIKGEAKKNLRSDPRRIDEGTLWNTLDDIMIGLKAMVYSPEPYAPFVHWGTGIHGESPEGGHRRTPWVYFDEKRQQFYMTSGMKPNMFLRDAWRTHEAALFKELKDCMTKSIIMLGGSSGSKGSSGSRARDTQGRFI